MRTLLWLCLLWAGWAAAHEVHHDIAASGAVSVRLTFADGSPFAYEKYELYAAGQEIPAQVGNTDAQGRVVFIAGDTSNWRLRAYAADGHGVDLEFAAPAIQTGPSVTPAVAATGPDRATQLLIGLAMLFGLFGLVQLFLRRSAR